ncbi:MAG: aldo/keto reductase [Lentisphaerae bacterium]|nr:aldo/keto reductase [Lentisphaerota bacterium]
MQYRKLGNSDLNVSVIALGTWQLTDTGYWGEGGKPAEAVRAALDHGIRFFDGAEDYSKGEAEQALGRALGGDRDKAVIATKVSPNHLKPEDVVTACEGSLKQLGTDVIDLYQVHWPNWKVPFADTYGALLRLREQGKIREIGISNFGPRDIEDWMQAGTAVSNQICYNLLFRAVEFEIVPACERHDLGILAYSPLMQGILSGRWKTIEDIPVPRRRTRHFADRRRGAHHGREGYEAATLKALQALEAAARDAGESMADLAMAWLLHQPGVASILVGGRKPDQVARNARAADITLDTSILQQLDALSTPLKDALGPNADPWNAGEAARIR